MALGFKGALAGCRAKQETKRPKKVFIPLKPSKTTRRYLDPLGFIYLVFQVRDSENKHHLSSDFICQRGAGNVCHVPESSLAVRVMHGIVLGRWAFCQPGHVTWESDRQNGESLLGPFGMLWQQSIYQEEIDSIIPQHRFEKTN